MREIIFYRTESGRCPVEEFLNTLSARQSAKVTWVLELVEELPVVPVQYFKKLVGTEDIWEVRVKVGRDIFRLLGFLDGSQVVVLNHAFAKKSQTIARSDIVVTEQRKREYVRRKQE